MTLLQVLAVLEYVPAWAAYGSRHAWLVHGKQGHKNKNPTIKIQQGFYVHSGARGRNRTGTPCGAGF